MPPTIILVHGAFAESASWNGVIEPLASAGHPVIAAATPLRGLAADAEAISDVVRSVDGPVVLVGHSYGGAVISNVAADAGEITGLVYVAGFAPDSGESCFELSAKFPGSTLGDAVRPAPRSDGTTDLTIAQDLFHDQFAADVPATKTARMAVTQRPVTLEALQEPSGERPLWKELPSWFVYGEEDRNIPAALQRFMAERALARRSVEIAGASHAVAVSNPTQTADMVLEAAAAPDPSTNSSAPVDPMALDALSPITPAADPMALDPLSPIIPTGTSHA
jgi:pimeloyl-ACP methyl ester carboxylesterase